MQTYTFEGNGEDFSATHEAENWLRENGFSVGSMQRDAPRGIVFGDYNIPKWRNLSKKDRSGLDGYMNGSRYGSATVNLNAPVESFKA